MKSKFKRFLIPTAVVLASFIIFIVMTLARPKPRQIPHVSKAPKVQTITLESQTARFSLTGSGTVRPTQNVILMPRVSGSVTYLADHFKSGMPFRKGDILLMIDSTDYVLQVESALASLARNQVALDQERAEAAIARQEWELYSSSSPSEQPSPLVLRTPQLQMAEANLMAAQAQLDLARLNLSRTRVRAPFNGLVGSREVALGQLVSVGSRLAEIFNTDEAEIDVPILPGDLTWLPLQPGSPPSQDIPVRVSAETGGSTCYWDGFLDRIEGNLDPRSRTATAVIRVDHPYSTNHESPLLNGLFAAVQITGKPVHNVTAIPNIAVRPESRIWMVGPDQKLIIDQIHVLHTDETHTYVESDLLKSSAIVTSALTYAVSGMPVELAGESR